MEQKENKENIYLNFFQKTYNPSFLDKLKNEINIQRLSKQKIKEMKNLLLVEAKPIFLESPKDKLFEKVDTLKFADATETYLCYKFKMTLNELYARYFDDKIKTLSKRRTYHLYNLFIDHKKLIETSNPDLAIDIFILEMQLDYYENWLRNVWKRNL